MENEYLKEKMKQNKEIIDLIKKGERTWWRPVDDKIDIHSVIITATDDVPKTPIGGLGFYEIGGETIVVPGDIAHMLMEMNMRGEDVDFAESLKSNRVIAYMPIPLPHYAEVIVGRDGD